ncbi:MAG: HAD family hydrolase [Planctomycetes bacterium]|nr:HAD family hydrolase [Planctomycetota bacterium]
MWSGPRNVSTAMMRSWGQRPDTFVTDEPLYAHYLSVTGLPHPGADETIAHHEADWRRVAAWLTGPIPEGRTVWYQKHMAHHLLPMIEHDWLEKLTHCFLIREPREMITSLIEFIPHPTIYDTGLPQQVEIFDQVVKRTGAVPPVVDGADVLRDPRGMMTKLCQRLGLEFTEDMLRWPPGPRKTDGVWAKHWYAKVEKTTGFGPYQPKDIPVPDALKHLIPECERLYQYLHQHRLPV